MQKLRRTSGSAFQVRYFHFPSICLPINYRNPEKRVTKCPIPTQMAFFNKGTVSCREYHISLIVLQIPFLIKIKIFILTSDDAACECVLFLVLWRQIQWVQLLSSFGRVTLVRKIYSNWFCFVCSCGYKNSQAKVNSTRGAGAWWCVGAPYALWSWRCEPKSKV